MNENVTTNDDESPYMGDPEIGIARAEDGETPKETRNDPNSHGE